MKKLHLGEYEVAYDSSGHPLGKSVVFLHGNPGSAQDLHPQLKESLKAEFNLVTYDRPGLGESPKATEPLTLNDQCLLLKQLLFNLDLKNVILLGHSYGGALSLKFAADYPELCDGMVLLAPWAYRRPKDRTSSLGSGVLANLIRLLVGRRLIEKHLRSCFAPSTAAQDLLKQKVKEFSQKDSFTSMLEAKSSLIDSFEKLENLYSSVACSAWVIASPQDQVIDFDTQARRLAETNPNFELIELEGQGHQLTWTNRKEILYALNELQKEKNQCHG